MGARSLVSVASLALALTTGCVGQMKVVPPRVSTLGPSPDPMRSVPLAPPLQPRSLTPARAQVLSSGADAGLENVEWQFVRLERGGSRLVFMRPDDPCSPDAGVVLSQSPNDVTIATKTEPVGACGAQFVPPVLQFVDLDEPLGDRALLHASTPLTAMPPQ